MDGVSTYLALIFGTLLSSQGTDASFVLTLSGFPPGASLRVPKLYQCFSGPMTTVTSPLAGRAIGLAAVPDPVFSGAMVGPGTAIDPVREPSEAVAPVDGVIVSLHPHAFVVVDEQGHGVLVHLGIDTVQLNG